MGQTNTKQRDRDRRVRRTRAAIVQSFNGLVLERGFDDVKVPDIVDDADVGRSTFYEHFRGKDEVLQHAATEQLRILADVYAKAGDVEEITGLLVHVRDNRKAVGEMLAGFAAKAITRTLIDLIEVRLAEACRVQHEKNSIPIRLAATQAAGGLLALLREWVSGRANCAPGELARLIDRSGKSHMAALRLTAV